MLPTIRLRFGIECRPTRRASPDQYEDASVLSVTGASTMGWKQTNGRGDGALHCTAEEQRGDESLLSINSDRAGHGTGTSTGTGTGTGTRRTRKSSRKGRASQAEICSPTRRVTRYILQRPSFSTSGPVEAKKRLFRSTRTSPGSRIDILIGSRVEVRVLEGAYGCSTARENIAGIRERYGAPPVCLSERTGSKRSQPRTGARDRKEKAEGPCGRELAVCQAMNVMSVGLVFLFQAVKRADGLF
ncbi:hypothetical protein F4780DRAFT_322852 [Xylariomycetidae sp. FL0641]|nr:hypothetical protein F4780DRAFT_322852 [Xylariomycetidae sp. FL0641]